jgi:hypothetical protein
MTTGLTISKIAGFDPLLPEPQIVINKQVVLLLTAIILLPKLPKDCSDPIIEDVPFAALLSVKIDGHGSASPIRFHARRCEADKVFR